LKGAQEGQPEIQMKRAKKITVTALTDKKLPAHADGEMLCVDGDEISAEILPGALEIISL
jgi:diacylglycerol kinase family enzyme